MGAETTEVHGRQWLSHRAAIGINVSFNLLLRE